MSRARGALCRACLALAAALAALLLLPLPRAPAPDPAPDPGPRAPPARPAAPRLRPDDVFIAVKTTRKNHGPRLDLLLRTWISRARRQVGGPAPSARVRIRGGPLPGPRRSRPTPQMFAPRTAIPTPSPQDPPRHPANSPSLRSCPRSPCVPSVVAAPGP